LLTARGFWLLVAAMAITIFGLTVGGGYTPAVPVLGLGLLAWFVVEWVVFTIRLRAATGRITVERTLRQGDRPVATIWAGMTAKVRVRVTLDSPFRIPFAWIADRIPAGYLDPVGAVKICTELAAGSPVVFEYEIKPPTPGAIRFEGVSIRIADLAGLFATRLFLRDPIEFLVLPALRDEEGKHRGEKRQNTLPPPGAHRLRRAGGGSELLDLRDYQPGDPPKTIAWKVSARRDKLITKEFENDVPVRCVIFLDLSNSVRIGPHWGTPIAKLADCAAAVTQASIANRDLVGLTTFNEIDSQPIPPSRTTTHKLRLMRHCSEAAALMPVNPQTDVDRLVKSSLSVASELYPDLLANGVNRTPLSLYWKPISDASWGWIVTPMFFAPAIFALLSYFVPGFANAVFGFTNRLMPTGFGWVLVLILIGLMPFLSYQIRFWYGVSGFRQKSKLSDRKKLGLLFAALDGHGPAEIERAIYDDHFVRERANRFLTDHNLRMTPSLVDDTGQYRFRSPEKADVLAQALLRAVARARDNEMYVILADLISLGVEGLGPVLKAVKAARARKHQVLIVVPWPEGLAKPPDAAGPRQLPPRPSLAAITKRSLESGFVHGYRELRRQLTSAGAAVVRIDRDEPVKMVLDRMDRLRGGRVRR
jgi:uncharacterized protein (DUF58 family)